MNNLSAVPANVLRAYGLSAALVQPIWNGNMVNGTYLVESDGTKYILQHLSPIFSSAVIDDFRAITTYLQARAWEAPALIATNTGANYCTGPDGRVWRLTSFIASDAMQPVIDDQVTCQMAELLAEFHVALETLAYRPQFRLEHFHDTAFIAAKLVRLTPKIKSEKLRTLAEQTISEYHSLPAMPKDHRQLIHGDPRANNYLFRDGKPFTIIDLDTIMLAPTWLDIADFIRSVAEEKQLAGTPLAKDTFERLCESYRTVAQPDSSTKVFLKKALDATMLITCELKMRFLNDLVEDTYFTFDPAVYPNRKALNTERALLQDAIYKTLVRIKETYERR